MAKYAHPDVLDNGPAYVKANATRMLLLSGYAAGDNYATVVAAKLAEVTIAPSDMTLTNNGAGRRLVGPTGKQATVSASSASPDLHVAFTDGVGKVLLVLDETSNQPITSGNPITFPVANYNLPQPV